MRISKGRIKNINKKIISGLLVVSILSTPFNFNKNHEVLFINTSCNDIIPKRKEKRLIKKYR